MFKLTDIWKDVLSRIAAGEYIDLSSIDVPTPIQDILARISSAKSDCKKDDVLALLKAHNPEVFIGYNKELSNTDVLYLLNQETAKSTLSDVERMITQAILKNQNNPLFSWDKLLKDIQDKVSKTNLSGRKYMMLNELVDLTSSRGVCSFGYDLLDCLDSGGVVAGSYTVYYGATGAGKSTVGTLAAAYKALKMGVKPLIVYLEGDYAKFNAKLQLLLAGFPIDNVEATYAKHKTEIKKYLDTLGFEIPVVNYGASSRYELDMLIRRYSAEVVIYDQLTKGSTTRDWQDMAKMSEVLSKLAFETGIPVIAMTQSDESNYSNGQDEEERDNNRKNQKGGVKYSQAIVEDASTLIHVQHTYPQNPKKRLLVIKKTKDDELAAKSQVTVEVEWTPHGMVDVAVISKENGSKTYTKKAEFLLMNKRAVLETSAIELPSKVKDTIPVVEHVEETKAPPNEDSNVKPKLNTVPSTLPGAYDQDRFDTTGARMSIVGDLYNCPALVDLGTTWDKYHKNQYGNGFIDVENASDKGLHQYLHYYHNGTSKMCAKVKKTAVEESTEEEDGEIC